MLTFLQYVRLCALLRYLRRERDIQRIAADIDDVRGIQADLRGEPL